MQDLLKQLRTLKVEGPGFGGPYVGISHNKVTRAIVARGEEIVPLLLDELDTCDHEAAAFIVFCLRQLRAEDAEEKIRQLQSSNRFGNVERDLTVDMQIQFFLRDAASW